MSYILVWRDLDLPCPCPKQFTYEFFLVRQDGLVYDVRMYYVTTKKFYFSDSDLRFLVIHLTYTSPTQYVVILPKTGGTQEKVLSVVFQVFTNFHSPRSEEHFLILI